VVIGDNEMKFSFETETTDVNCRFEQGELVTISTCSISNAEIIAAYTTESAESGDIHPYATSF
jgi:hypothetical protein